MQKGDKKTQIKKSASKYAEKIKVDATFIELLNLTFKDADKKVKARSNKKNY